MGNKLEESMWDILKADRIVEIVREVRTVIYPSAKDNTTFLVYVKGILDSLEVVKGSEYREYIYSRLDSEGLIKLG